MSNQPSKSQVHVNAPLTNVSVAFDQADDHFVAHQAFPVVPVEKDSDIYTVYDQHDWMRDDAKIRAPGSPPEYSGFNITNSNTYSCQRYDLAKKIPDDIRDNADAIHNLDRLTTQWLTKQLMIRREVAWCADYFVTGKWGSNELDISGLAAQWDEALGVPIDNVDTGRKAILAGTGMEPNVLIVGYDTHLALKKNPQVIDRVKYVAGQSFNLAIAPRKAAAQVLAEMFEVDKYLVSKAVYSSDAEGVSTETYGMIASDNALLVYVPSSPSLMTPSAGYCFRSRKFGGNGRGLRVKKWRNDECESDVIEVAYKEDMVQVAAGCGYFFLDTVS
jgi:hypothetical protein